MGLSLGGDDPLSRVRSTLPADCQLVLRHPLATKDDPGQSYRIVADRESGSFQVKSTRARQERVLPSSPPAGRAVGKVATCPFCEHVHERATHSRMAEDGLGEDALLVVADIDDTVGKLIP